jgi:hypothetical protein
MRISICILIQFFNNISKANERRILLHHLHGLIFELVQKLRLTTPVPTKNTPNMLLPDPLRLIGGCLLMSENKIFSLKLL